MNTKFKAVVWWFGFVATSAFADASDDWVAERQARGEPVDVPAEARAYEHSPPVTEGSAVAWVAYRKATGQPVDPAPTAAVEGSVESPSFVGDASDTWVAYQVSRVRAVEVARQ